MSMIPSDQDDNYYPNEYKKYKKQLSKLEDVGEGTNRDAGKLRGTLISIWNKMTPKQQKEIAATYIAD